MLRIFLVGCPRSGTTVVQAALAAHPALCSFPETHFFVRARPLNALRRWTGWPARRVRRFWPRWLADHGHPDLAAAAQPAPWTSRYADVLVTAFDALAKAQNKMGWVEKTPAHIYRVADIARHVEHARFIHIVRSGPDVVSSLYAVARAYPAIWRSRWRWLGRRGLTLGECAARWNRAVAATQHWAGRPGHFVLRYEDLLARPEEVLRALCRFLGLAYDPAMLNPESRRAAITSPDEPWKLGGLRVDPHAAHNHEGLLTPRQLRFVQRTLRTVTFPTGP